jgi:capsular polysaccharide biosynthesis protein
MPWHSISEFGTWWSPGVFKELRKKLGLHKASVTNATRKILLSRKNTRWRRLVNEDELYKSLEKFGFEMIDIGTLSVKQQFELGQQTSCLITPLGANSNFFLNLPSGANVIELAPPMEFMNVTGPFATASGLNYKQIVGTANNTPGISKIDQDYSVDCSLVIDEFCSLTS